MIRVLLVHAKPMTCELLTAVLSGEEDIQIVGCAHSHNDAFAQLKKQQCNTVLVDVNLPDVDTLALARKLCQENENLKVLIMGLVRSHTAILRCIEEGAAGYILEEDSLADLVKKIRAVHEDEFMLSPGVAAALMSRVAELKQMTKDLYGISYAHTSDLFTELTQREWQVLKLIEQGLNNQQIAEQLVIEKGTVKNHVHNILSKLDVRSREQAALLARQFLSDQSSDVPVHAEPAVSTFSLRDLGTATLPHHARKQAALS